MLQEAFNFKQNFFIQLEELKIPTHNRAVCFYYLALELEKNPDNKQLQQLLITAVCDQEFLLCHFLPEQSPQEIIENYRATRLKSNTLNKLLSENKQFSKQWEQITKRKTLPVIDNFSSTKNNLIQNEINMLCQLYYEYFPVSKRNSPELKNNLKHFVELSHSYKDYHLIAPFFFYQLMIKHTKRLASNANLEFIPKSLWKYKEYKIIRNNEKNYETYQNNILLFLDLCKYYELYSDVNIELCKYAFSQTSNLIEWIEFYDEELADCCRTPLALFYQSLDLSHIEPYEPPEYDIFSTYDVSSETDRHYNELYWKEYLQIEDTVTNFLLENIDYLITCMREIHRDIKTLKNTILQIYESANLANLYPPEVPINYRLSNIYFILSNYIDTAVTTKITSTLENLEVTELETR